MALRIFLGISALVWIPYGIYCWFQPGFLEAAAGVAATTPTGTTELRAMYGGLQVAIGALMAAALVRPSIVPAALFSTAFLCGGLGIARFAGAVADASFSAYTLSGLAFEFGLLAVAVWLIRSNAELVRA
jgi:hypothetical protein